MKFDSISNVYAYPLLHKNVQMRTKLIENDVYVPQLWKYLLDKPINKFEEKLSNYLFPIAVDQRYNIEDMSKIVNIIINAYQ